MQTLNQMKPGDHGVIVALEGADVVSQRLLEMGLTEGEPIEVLALAPFGDPIDVRIRSYQLSLRKNEAARVVVDTR
jgi:ferrous iron transport protein A